MAPSRWLVLLGFVQLVACSSSVEPEAGSGGSGSGASTGSDPHPIACSLGEGAPAGAPCDNEGEICDYAGSGCWVECTDGFWAEACAKCPDEAPEAGTDCTYGVGPCTYDSGCGTVTATCDEVTWSIAENDCG